MSLTKDDLKQIGAMLDDQRSLIAMDTKQAIEQALGPIRDKIELLENKLDQVKTMLEEDIKAVYEDMEDMKIEIRELKKKVGKLERMAKAR